MKLSIIISIKLVLGLGSYYMMLIFTVPNNFETLTMRSFEYAVYLYLENLHLKLRVLDP